MFDFMRFDNSGCGKNPKPCFFVICFQIYADIGKKDTRINKIHEHINRPKGKIVPSRGFLEGGGSGLTHLPPGGPRRAHSPQVTHFWRGVSFGGKIFFSTWHRKINENPDSGRVPTQPPPPPRGGPTTPLVTKLKKKSIWFQFFKFSTFFKQDSKKQ